MAWPPYVYFICKTGPLPQALRMRDPDSCPGSLWMCTWKLPFSLTMWTKFATSFHHRDVMFIHSSSNTQHAGQGGKSLPGAKIRWYRMHFPLSTAASPCSPATHLGPLIALLFSTHSPRSQSACLRHTFGLMVQIPAKMPVALTGGPWGEGLDSQL